MLVSDNVRAEIRTNTKCKYCVKFDEQKKKLHKLSLSGTVSELIAFYCSEFGNWVILGGANEQKSSV